MATQADYQSLRDDLDVSRDLLTDPMAERVYLDSAKQYVTTRTIYTGARLIAIRRLIVKASKLTKYKQNNSEEDPTSIVKALKDLYDIWKDEHKAAIEQDDQDAEDAMSTVRFGKPALKPQRVIQVPYEPLNYR